MLADDYQADANADAHYDAALEARCKGYDAYWFRDGYYCVWCKRRVVDGACAPWCEGQENDDG